MACRTKSETAAPILKKNVSRRLKIFLYHHPQEKQFKESASIRWWLTVQFARRVFKRQPTKVPQARLTCFFHLRYGIIISECDGKPAKTACVGRMRKWSSSCLIFRATFYLLQLFDIRKKLALQLWNETTRDDSPCPVLQSSSVLCRTEPPFFCLSLDFLHCTVRLHAPHRVFCTSNLILSPKSPKHSGEDFT